MKFIAGLFKATDPAVDKVNEHNQVADRKILRSARYKFGFANIFYQGEEAGLGTIHAVIIRALGGGALHLGIILENGRG